MTGRRQPDETNYENSMSATDHVELLNRLKKEGYEFDVIYDVGSNIGEWSVDVQELFPNARFELFEPLVGQVEDIDTNLMTSRLHDAVLHPVALSDENRKGEIKILGHGGQGSSILVHPADRRRDDFRIVPCEMARMDDYVARHGLRPPDFIKLDTQASELKVLKGGEDTIRNAKFILAETWMRRVYGPGTPLFQEIATWLLQHDFMLYDFIITDAGRDADGTLRWLDAVYINRSASKFQPTLL